MSGVKVMSKRAADIVFGPGGAGTDFDRDLYELHKLADKVIAALDARSTTGLRIAGVGEVLSVDLDDPQIPVIEWSLPMPVWEPADFSIEAIGAGS